MAVFSNAARSRTVSLTSEGAYLCGGWSCIPIEATGWEHDLYFPVAINSQEKSKTYQPVLFRIYEDFFTERSPVRVQ